MRSSSPLKLAAWGLLAAMVDFLRTIVNGTFLGPVSSIERAWAPSYSGMGAFTTGAPILMMEPDSEDEGSQMGAAAETLDRSSTRLEDAELVARIIDGDQESYRLLVERYQSKIFAVAYGLLHNREDAREVAQEAFIKAYRNLPGFRRDSSFYTWIYRITVNLGIDFRRKAYRGRETELDETRLVPEDAHHTGPRPMPTPGKSLERKQLASRIRLAIDLLPADQKTAIVLREIQGLSYKEIADAMDCAEGTVMSRLFYGRKKLQELLDDLR